MDVALDPSDERRGRRLGIAVRLVLYPVLLGVIVLAWQHYHGDSPKGHPFHVTEWSGTTSQGQAMRATTGNGRLSFLDTHVLERCSNGAIFNAHWLPAQHRFVQRGKYVRGSQAFSGRTYSGEPDVGENRLWATMGDHPHGTIHAQVLWTTGGRKVRCASGPVTFSLHRAP